MSPLDARRYAPKLKARPVTIVIGFTCKDAIILASDSQFSFDGSTHKQTGISKLARVEFADGTAVLIAKAGSGDLGNYFYEIFENKARGTKIISARTIPDLTEQAMREAKVRFIDAFQPEHPSPEDIQQRVRDYPYTVMLAYYFNGEPKIFVLPSWAGIAVRQTDAFAATGAGSSLASYVLTGMDVKPLTGDHALTLAAYVVEVCKQNDVSCGGDVQLGLIAKEDSACKLLSADSAKPYTTPAWALTFKTQPDLLHKITDIFDLHKVIYFNKDGTRQTK